MQLEKGIRELRSILQVPYEVKIIISPLLFLLPHTYTRAQHTHTRARNVKSLQNRPRQTTDDHLIHPVSRIYLRGVYLICSQNLLLADAC